MLFLYLNAYRALYEVPYLEHTESFSKTPVDNRL